MTISSRRLNKKSKRITSTDGKKVRPHFQVGSTFFGESAEEKLFQRSSVLHSSDLFSSRVTKALYAGSSCGKSPSVGVKKAKNPRKASGSKSTKKSTVFPLSGNYKIDVYLVWVEVLLVSFLKKQLLFCCSFFFFLLYLPVVFYSIVISCSSY